MNDEYQVRDWQILLVEWGEDVTQAVKWILIASIDTWLGEDEMSDAVVMWVKGTVVHLRNHHDDHSVLQSNFWGKNERVDVLELVMIPHSPKGCGNSIVR